MPHLRSALVLTSVLALGCGPETRRVAPVGGGGMVNQRTLVSISVSLDSAILGVGESATAQVVAAYDDGTTGPLVSGITWTSDNPAVATVQNGQVTAVAQGSAVITAAVGTRSATADVTVTPAGEEVASIEIAPDPMAMQVGGSARLSANAIFVSGNRADVTASVTWNSSAPDVFSVDATGVARALSVGSAVVTASFGGVTAQATWTVVGITSVEVGGPQGSAPITLSEGGTIQLTANGVNSDGTRQNVTNTANWTSSNPAAVTVNASGLAQAVGLGQATVTASFGAISGTFSITVQGCSYPSAGSSISLNQTMPALEWRGAYDSAGNQVDFSMTDFHCGQGPFAQYSSVALVVSAGWCPNCPEYLRRVDAVAQQVEAEGGLVVYVEIETRSRQPASNTDANGHAAQLGLNYGLRVGDAATAPIQQAVGRAVSSVPNAFFIRKSDMQVVAFQQASQYYLDFVELAREANNGTAPGPGPGPGPGPNPGNCTEESFEPNDTPAQAGVLTSGASVSGGVCAAGPDFYQVNVSGSWTLDLTFSNAEGDLDVYVVDPSTGMPMNGPDGRPIGSESTSDNESFSHSGQSLIVVTGYQGANANYDLTIR